MASKITKLDIVLMVLFGVLTAAFVLLGLLNASQGGY
jgi:hypothetical protein